VDFIIISLKINLFSPWYSWNIAELALSKITHSLTHFCDSVWFLYMSSQGWISCWEVLPGSGTITIPRTGITKWGHGNQWGFVTRVTRRAQLAEQELLTILEHMCSSPVRVARSLVLCVVFCRSLFVLLSFFSWPLYCLFFDIRILIAPLVSSNSSNDKHQQHTNYKTKL